MAILRNKKHPVGFYKKLNNGCSCFIPFKDFNSRKSTESLPNRVLFNSYFPNRVSQAIKYELHRLNNLILKHLTCSSTKSPLIKCEMEPIKQLCNYLTKNFALTNR